MKRVTFMMKRGILSPVKQTLCPTGLILENVLFLEKGFFQNFDKIPACAYF